VVLFCERLPGPVDEGCSYSAGSEATVQNCFTSTQPAYRFLFSLCWFDFKLSRSLFTPCSLFGYVFSGKVQWPSLRSIPLSRLRSFSTITYCMWLREPSMASATLYGLFAVGIPPLRLIISGRLSLFPVHSTPFYRRLIFVACSGFYFSTHIFLSVPLFFLIFRPFQSSRRGLLPPVLHWLCVYLCFTFP